MIQQKHNRELIFGLSVLYGFWLIGILFVYSMGKEDGFLNALRDMGQHIPTCIVVMMGSLMAGISLNNSQLLNESQIKVQLTKTHFILMTVLCLLFFPVGLFFLLGKKNLKKAES